MADTGWVLAGQGRAVNRTSGTGAGWTNPGNITTDDGTNAAYSLSATVAAVFSHWIVADQFDFSSVPSGATINGVEVRGQLSVNNAAGSTIHAVVIGKDDSTQGTEKAPATAVTTSPVDYDNGSASDLWGLTLSDAEVKSSNFQARISVRNGTGFSTRNFSADAIWMRVTYTPDITIDGSADITEANDTVSADSTLELQGSLSKTEGDDTLSVLAGLEIQGSLAAIEGDDVPTAAGELAVTGSLLATEADDTLASNATLTVAANAAITEGHDVPSSSGTVDLIGSAFIAEGNDTLTGNGAIPLAANAAITEGDDTLDGLAQMPIVYPRRGGVDEREEYERRQRQWRESLRRIIDRAWAIAYGLIDPITLEPIPPPDHSRVIAALIDEARALDRSRAETFVAELRRAREEEAIALLLLAA